MASDECKACEKKRDKLIKTSPAVRFMLHHISHLKPTDEQLSSTIPSSTPHLPVSISCQPCNSNARVSAYHPSVGVIMCSDNIGKASMGLFEDAMTHELIHEYDFRRFKVDMNNLRHLACTEVFNKLI